MKIFGPIIVSLLIGSTVSAFGVTFGSLTCLSMLASDRLKVLRSYRPSIINGGMSYRSEITGELKRTLELRKDGLIEAANWAAFNAVDLLKEAPEVEKLFWLEKRYFEIAHFGNDSVDENFMIVNHLALDRPYIELNISLAGMSKTEKTQKIGALRSLESKTNGIVIEIYEDTVTLNSPLSSAGANSANAAVKIIKVKPVWKLFDGTNPPEQEPSNQTSDPSN